MKWFDSIKSTTFKIKITMKTKNIKKLNKANLFKLLVLITITVITITFIVSTMIVILYSQTPLTTKIKITLIFLSMPAIILCKLYYKEMRNIKVFVPIEDTIERYYYPNSDGFCLNLCAVKKDGTKIGSITCQTCENNVEFEKSNFNTNARWIKCTKIKEAIQK